MAKTLFESGGCGSNRYAVLKHQTPNCSCTHDEYDAKMVAHIDCPVHGERPVGVDDKMVQCDCGKVRWPRGATRSGGGIPDNHSMTKCGPGVGDRGMVRAMRAQRGGIVEGPATVTHDANYRPPPEHYATDEGIDPWKVWDVFGLDKDAYVANAVKYLLRAGKKDIAPRLDDLKKARDYVNKAIEREESQS